MNFKNNTNTKDNKSFVSDDEPFIPNQIDTTGFLLAEILKIVQRVEKKQDEYFNKISNKQNGY